MGANRLGPVAVPTRQGSALRGPTARLAWCTYARFVQTTVLKRLQDFNGLALRDEWESSPLALTIRSRGQTGIILIKQPISQPVRSDIQARPSYSVLPICQNRFSRISHFRTINGDRYLNFLNELSYSLGINRLGIVDFCLRTKHISYVACNFFVVKKCKSS